MAKIKLKPSGSVIVVMSKMDYEIAKRVYERSFVIGISDEEISFLMGKRNKYFFDLLNPCEKDKIKTEQLDILPTVMQCTIRQLVPDDVKAGEQIRIRGFKKVLSSKIVYKHVVIYADGTESLPIEWIKKLVKGERRKVNEALHLALLQLVADGYFASARNALELFLTLKDIKGLSFSPADLQKSLAVLMNRKRQEPAALECKNENARYWYKQIATN